MSATQLASFVVAATLAALLAITAIGVVIQARRAGTYHQDRDGLSSPVGCFAVALLVAAAVVLGLGVMIAAKSYDVPPVPDTWSGRCAPGTYDNGGDRYGGPICIPWPDGRR